MCVFVFFSIGCTHGPPLPPASVQQYGANDKMDTRATHIYQGTPHLDWAETEDIYYDFYIFLYTYTIYFVWRLVVLHYETFSNKIEDPRFADLLSKSSSIYHIHILHT